MTPNEFLAEYCKRTGMAISACGGSGVMNWESVLEVLVFAHQLAAKPFAPSHAGDKQ